MKINKISSKLIKPHTPTPQNLKNYKLSFLDKAMVAMNIVVVLFYESKPEDEIQLEESLAKILVDFYPLAGRYIKSEDLVDCSDQGAEFVEAEAADIKLLDLVAETEFEQRQLVPYFNGDEAAVDPLLSIQITHFPCGGVVIGISISHRVFDGMSVGTFIAAWSSASNNKMVGVSGIISPSFHLPSLLPIKENGDSSDNPFPLEADGEIKVVTRRRLVFDKVGLASLKSKIRPRNDGKSVSGVRIVSALIAKALIGLDRAKHGRSRDFVIPQPINLRERTVFVPQPKQSCGNFSVIAVTQRVAASEAEYIGIQELVDLLGDAVRKSISDHAQVLSSDMDGRDILTNTLKHLVKELCGPETNFIGFNDWSKFGFYEADFGWGTPVLTSPMPQRHNCTLLMSNKEGDGIEAWVYLDQDDMPYFEEIIKSLH